MEVNAGKPYNQAATVPGQPEEVIQQLGGGLAAVPGYTMTPTGPRSLVLTRSFMPQWALITGIIAGLLTCIGFLVLLVKEQETLSVTAMPADGGTRLEISGAANPAMAGRLPAVISGLGGELSFAGAFTPGYAAPPRPSAPPAPASPSAPAVSSPDSPAGWHPDPTGRHEQRYWDGHEWTQEVMDKGAPSTDPV